MSKLWCCLARHTHVVKQENNSPERKQTNQQPHYQDGLQIKHAYPPPDRVGVLLIDYLALKRSGLHTAALYLSCELLHRCSHFVRSSTICSGSLQGFVKVVFSQFHSAFRSSATYRMSGSCSFFIDDISFILYLMYMFKCAWSLMDGDYAR